MCHLGHALSHLSGKVGHAPPKGARPSKRGAPFPIYQTVCQELRMDGGIAKSGSAFRNWTRTHTHSATLVSCLSSSKPRCWRGCVVVDRPSQVQVRGAHLLLQQQVLGALPFPEERTWTRTNTHSAALVSCLSSSKLRCWRGCVVVDRSSQLQVLSAHFLLQQQVLGACPPPEERTSSSYLSLPFLFTFKLTYFRICLYNIFQRRIICPQGTCGI
jgi:hypothetical protein